MRSTDLGLAIPGLLLVAAIATILGRGELSLMLGLAAVFWAPIARVTYGQAVVLRERRYVEAATVQGAGRAWVLRRHVLPHLAPVVGAYAALSVGWAVLFEASLGFLGAGIPEPTASIGGLLGRRARLLPHGPGADPLPRALPGPAGAGGQPGGRVAADAGGGRVIGYVGRRLLTALITVWLVATAGFLLVEIDPRRPGTLAGRPQRVRGDASSASARRTASTTRCPSATC